MFEFCFAFASSWFYCIAYWMFEFCFDCTTLNQKCTCNCVEADWMGVFWFVHILILLYSGLNVWVLFCTTLNQKRTCNCVKADWMLEFCFAFHTSWFYSIADWMYEFCSAKHWVKSAHVIVLKRIECLSPVLLFTHPDSIVYWTECLSSVLHNIESKVHM